MSSAVRAVVAFEDVAKRYLRGRERANLRAAIPGRWGEPRGGDEHWALDGLSFELAPGGSLGLVGPNGAGKSTTLKLVARVIAPTRGSVHVRGRAASLIELGAGFHPEMTGRENVEFSASVLGMGPRTLRTRFDEIVGFADIGAYLDSPVKRYSSGMLARLGFAVASHLDADVLVLDEVLAVGDAEFQRRCHARIRHLREEGAALLYVTHALWTLPMLCDEAVLLAGGAARAQGTPHEVLRAYERLQDQSADERTVPGDGPRVLRSLRAPTKPIRPGDPVDVRVDLDLAVGQPEGQLVIAVSDSLERVHATVTTDGAVDFSQPGPRSVRCRLERVDLQPGQYGLMVAFLGDRNLPAVDDVRTATLQVEGDSVEPGFGPLRVPATWQVRRTRKPR